MLPDLKLKNYHIVDSKDGIKMFIGTTIIPTFDNGEIDTLYKWLSERRKILDGFVLAKISPTQDNKDELVFVSGPTSKVIGKNTNYNIRKLLADLKSRGLPYDDVIEVIIKYGEVNLSLH